MPIYLLNDEVVFPPVDGAEDGVVAVGGDLSPERLVLAYQSGIFPWYNPDEPIVWWSPDPRCVIFPDKVKISRSMRRTLHKNEFSVTYDQAFEAVVTSCKDVYRPGQEGTWITEEMKEAYVSLHQLGHAHSVEVWKGSRLVGGIYGVKVGRVFCGESMFSLESNASKVALIHFLKKFSAEGGQLLDCQVHNDHLESLGAEMMPRYRFLSFLHAQG